MTWQDVTGRDVTWRDMTWHDVTWRDMTWHDVTWRDMTWHDVTWFDMTWRDVAWHYMTLRDMTWHDVIWRDITWHDAKWRDGLKMPPWLWAHVPSPHSSVNIAGSHASHRLAKIHHNILGWSRTMIVNDSNNRFNSLIVIWIILCNMNNEHSPNSSHSEGFLFFQT